MANQYQYPSQLRGTPGSSAVPTVLGDVTQADPFSQVSTGSTSGRTFTSVQPNYHKNFPAETAGNLGNSTFFYQSTVDPTTSNDGSASQGFLIGSHWFNTTTGTLWCLENNAAGAAVWLPIFPKFQGRLLSANMNTTTDQAISLYIPAGAHFRVTKITVKNASISLTTAAGGIYTAASKGGTAVVANTQVYTALTSATLATDLTIATTPGNTVFAGTTPLILSLTTAQGAAATADIYVYADIYG